MLTKTTNTIRILFAKHWPLFGVLIIAIFFRTYNGFDRYALGKETLRDAYVGIIGAEQLQFPLTGPFSSLGPFTFGPWYWYLLIIGNLLFSSPSASWIILGVCSLLTVILYYGIGYTLFKRYGGIVLALCAALSNTHILASTHLTNPNMIHVFVALSLYLFIKAYKKYNAWTVFFLGLALGIGANIHYQMFGLFILAVVLGVIHFRHIVKIGLLSAAGIVLSFLPLVFFDMNNHWYTVGNMWYFVRFGKDAIYVPNRWLFYVRDFWPAFFSDIFGVPVWLGIVLMVAVGSVVAYLLVTRKLRKLYVILLAVFLVEFIRLRYHWGERFYGYLHYLHPFIFIFTTLTFYTLFKKYRIAGIVLTAAFFVFMAYRQIPRLYDDAATMQYRIYATELMTRYPDESIQIYSCKTDPSIPYSVRFILDQKHQGGEEIRKIGYYGKKCISFPDVPDNVALPTLEMMLAQSAASAKYLPLDLEQTVDITQLTDEEIVAEGWKLITPEIIFTESTRWWFTEQP